MIKKYVFPFSKMRYFKGKKPLVDCILCATKDRDPKVESLVIGESENICVTINLYPYNSGHLMLFPKRHVTDIRDLNETEANEIHKLTQELISVLEKIYGAQGFTVGYNLGNNSGASIDHIHQHIIPRFPNELGVIDLVGGAKVIIEDPFVTQKRIKDELKSSNLFIRESI